MKNYSYSAIGAWHKHSGYGETIVDSWLAGFASHLPRAYPVDAQTRLLLLCGWRRLLSKCIHTIYLHRKEYRPCGQLSENGSTPVWSSPASARQLVNRPDCECRRMKAFFASSRYSIFFGFYDTVDIELIFR